jgi:hypothetical protein
LFHGPDSAAFTKVFGTARKGLQFIELDLDPDFDSQGYDKGLLATYETITVSSVYEYFGCTVPFAL